MKSKPSVPKVKNKTPAKLKSKAKAKLDSPLGPSREHSVSIRKIANGYVTRVSEMIGKGADARYVEKETFSKAQPKVSVPK